MIYILSMLSFLIAIVAMLAGIAVLAQVVFKSLYVLYKRYKYITSDEFKAISQNMPREVKLNYTFNGLSRLIGTLLALFIVALIANAPVYVVLMIVLALILTLNCNRKILRALGKL